MEEPIVVSAVVFVDGDTVLVVRKRGTAMVMLPGGKPEPGEDAVATAVRECAEEIGVRVPPEQLVELGVFETAAANEPGRRLVSTVYVAPGRPTAAAGGEIEHVEWLAAGTDRPDVAPLLRDAVLPTLRAAGHLSVSEA